MESWPEFGEDLRTLVDKAYPSLDDEVWQQLVLQRYLSQLDNEQVAFSVEQRKPKTIEAAVGATQNGAAIAPVQMEPKDSALIWK